MLKKIEKEFRIYRRKKFKEGEFVTNIIVKICSASLMELLKETEVIKNLKGQCLDFKLFGIRTPLVLDEEILLGDVKIMSLKEFADEEEEKLYERIHCMF